MRFCLRPILLIIVLFSTSIACSIPIRGMVPAETESPGNADLPLTVEEFIDQKGQINPDNGTITITMTQDELTAYLNSYLASQSNINLQDPQIILSEDRIDVYGNLKESIVSADIKISLTAGVNESGEVDVNILEADLGLIPVPENLLDTFTSSIKETLTNSIAAASNGARINQITINDGSMTITGSYQ